jgi:hypothetical protein
VIEFTPSAVTQQTARDLIALMREHGVALSLGPDGPEGTGDPASLALWAPVIQRHRAALADALAHDQASAARDLEPRDAVGVALDMLNRFAAVVGDLEELERADDFDPVQALELASALARLGGSERRVPTVDEATELCELITVVAAAHGFDADQLQAARELAADQFDHALALYRRLARNAGISLQPAADGGSS